LIVHHTGGSASNPLADSSNFTFEQCNTLHKKQFNFISSLGFYVGYHYYIEKNGTLKQASLNTDLGAHTIGKNAESIGICLAGNFDLTLPTSAQISTLVNLLESLSKVYNIPKENIVPHRRFAIKTCYGQRLMDDWARKLLNKPMFKLALINLDVTDPELAQFPDALKAEVNRLSDGKFPLEVAMFNLPKTDALQNLDGNIPGIAVGLTRPYLKKCIDESGVTGYQTTGVLFHWDGLSGGLNIRPRAHGAYNSTQMIESWFFHKEDLKPQPMSPMPGWIWSIVHELCHSIFFRLNDMGISERDTTHDSEQWDFRNEFATFNKYIPQLTTGVGPQPTPVPEPMMEFLKGDKKDDIFVFSPKDAKYHPFAEPEIYAPFAPFGKVKIIPQAEMDAKPKGLAVAYALVD